MSTPGVDEPRGRLTYADYVSLPDDGCRYQLVEGELVVMASPNTRHQLVVGEIYYRLRQHVDHLQLGRVMVSPLDVVLDDHNVLQPDVIFVSDARAGIVVPKNLQGAPDLCVEVLSPGTERIDRVRKLELYARFGVPHYWIVDLEARTIEEYLLERDVYRVRSVTALDEEFRPALFPSWSLAIATVLPA